jgi:hypothetical protein
VKFKEIDYLHHIPLVVEPTLTLLFFPPASCTPSGFYLLEPNGLGGNKITLVKQVDVDPRTAKAWYVSCSERQRIIREGLGCEEVQSLLAAGTAKWSSLPAEELAERIMNDPNTAA